MKTGSSFIESAKHAAFIGSLLIVNACAPDEAAAGAVRLERLPVAIVCLAYLDLHAEAVRASHESGNLQSIAGAKDLWRTSALAAAPPEEVEALKIEAKAAIAAQTSGEIGDEAANCIARAPRYLPRR